MSISISMPHRTSTLVASTSPTTQMKRIHPRNILPPRPRHFHVSTSCLGPASGSSSSSSSSDDAHEAPLTMLSASFLRNARLPPLPPHLSSSSSPPSSSSHITPSDFAQTYLEPVPSSQKAADDDEGSKPMQLSPAFFPSLVGKGSPYAWEAVQSWSRGAVAPSRGDGGHQPGPTILDLSGMRAKDHLESRVVDVELSARGRGYGDGVRKRLQEEMDIGRGGGLAGETPGGETQMVKGKEALWEKGRLSFGLFVDAFVSGKIPWSSGDASGSEGDSPAPDLVGYVAQQDLLSDSPALSAECPPLPHQSAGKDGSRKQWRRNLWIGGADTFTPPHTDPYHNLYAQVVGYKRVHLFPPRSGQYLSLFPVHTGQGNTSALPDEELLLSPDATSQLEQGAVRGGRAMAVDEGPGNVKRGGEDPLLNTYLLDKALEDPLARHVVLSPGDVLFIPRGWYHCLRSLSTSVGVNAWFG